jgi:hypothetical protein
MDKIAQFKGIDREHLIRLTYEKKDSIIPVILEKDFWVVWVLKQISRLGISKHLCFRGGTSLSKVHGVIDRFSEDIDLGIDRTFFDFDDKELEQCTTSSQADRVLRNLNRRTRQYLKDELTPTLRKEFKQILGDNNWELDFVHKDRQYWIFFRYPTCLSPEDYGGSGYVKPEVKLEILSRTENTPSSQQQCTSYIYHYFPEQFQEGYCRINTISLGRTFWEKVTMLHKEFNQEKLTTERISRHLYDIYMISKIDNLEEIISNSNLLREVIEHKKVFFRQPTAKYDKIYQGKLNIIPDGNMLDQIKSDYADMQEMIFDDYPEFDTLITELKTLENKINLMM